MSLTATTSMSSKRLEARKTLRPILPKPLMPSLIATHVLLCRMRLKSRSCRAQNTEVAPMLGCARSIQIYQTGLFGNGDKPAQPGVDGRPAQTQAEGDLRKARRGHGHPS